MTAYKTYRHEYTEQDLDEYELIKTDPGIKRPPCPVCHAGTYVTPMQYGLPDTIDVVEDRCETGRETFASVTYSCVQEPYNWDCAHCFIRF